MNKLILQFSNKPENIFLIDSIGALLTAVVLFVLVRPFHAHFGLPGYVVTSLSALAVLLSIYSAACYLFLKNTFAPFMRFIAFANLAYCIWTIGLLIHHRSEVTILGISYFLIESAIICSLSYVELRVAHACGKNA